MEVAAAGTGGARPRGGTWKKRLGNHSAVDRWDKEERISTEYHAKDVPDFLERNERSRIEKIAAKRQEDAQRVREETQANYDDKVFKFHQTKGGWPIEEVRQVIKERRAKELQFDASIYNAPPDFSRLHKTDYLARKTTCSASSRRTR